MKRNYPKLSEIIRNYPKLFLNTNFTFLLAFSMIAALNQFSFAQGSNWRIDGNSNASSTTFLGSTTNQPLIFKTNSLERMRITGSGGFVFQGLGASLGFLTTDASGNLQKTAFTGNANHVLLANGTFGAVPTIGSYFTLSSPTQITTSYKLGIGVSSPAEMLEVNGNGVFNGSVTAQGLNITDVTYAGKTLFYRNNGMCMDGFDAIAGTQNEICAMNAPLFINSKPTFAFNTYLNASNSGKVGIGTTNPQGKLDVDGTTFLRGKLTLTEFEEPTRTENLLLAVTKEGEVKATTKADLLNLVYPPVPYAFNCLVDANGNPIQAQPYWISGPGKIWVGGPCIDDVMVGIGLSPANSKFHIRTNEAAFPNTKAILVENAAGYKTFQVNADGLVYAREVKVNLDALWPDYVFEKDYKLAPLSEVKKYILENKHLPNVPSAAEVKENGLSLGEGNKVLLEKVEELTLYLIQMEEQMKAQQAEIDALKSQIK